MCFLMRLPVRLDAAPLFRRYAIHPSPRKPKITSAQRERGHGTAARWLANGVDRRLDIARRGSDACGVTAGLPFDICAYVVPPDTKKAVAAATI